MTNGANPAAAARRVAVLVLTLGIAATCTGCWVHPSDSGWDEEAGVDPNPECVDSSTCAPGLICREPLIEGEERYSRCRTPLAQGELCCNSDQCASGLLCAGECFTSVCRGSDAVCKTGSDLVPATCRKPAEIGEACFPFDYRPTGCRPGLFCVATLTEGKCGDPCVGTCHDGGRGAPCAWHDDCQDGLVCRTLDLLGPRTCALPPTVGELCLDYGLEYGLDCEEGLSCLESDSGAVCGPTKQLGEECGDDEDCGYSVDAFCDDLNGSPPVCRSQNKLGEFCKEYAQQPCEGDLECYGEPVAIDLDSEPFGWTSEAKRCGLPGRIGAPCGGSSCLEGRCVSRTCVPVNDGWLGDLCYSVLSIGCQEGLVCNWSFQPATCQPPGEVGEPCAWTPHCREGLVCSPGVDFMFTYDLEAMTEAMLNSVCSDPTLTSEPCDPSSPYVQCPGGESCSDYFDPPICTIYGTYGSSCRSGVGLFDWALLCNKYLGFFCDDWDGGKCTTKVPEEPEYPFN